MDRQLALGLWSSNFGAVKLERDPASGEDAVNGIWIYDRSGEEVIGYFAGAMRGNVLEFNWHEPAQQGDLTGAGFISFEADGLSFSGRWWSHDQQRSGVFHGKRDRVLGPADPSQISPGAYGGQTYGGQTYGGQSYGGQSYGTTRSVF